MANVGHLLWVVVARSRVGTRLESLLQGGFGNLVVGLELMGVIECIGDHVESVLAHAWLSPLTVLGERAWEVESWGRAR